MHSFLQNKFVKFGSIALLALVGLLILLLITAVLVSNINKSTVTSGSRSYEDSYDFVTLPQSDSSYSNSYIESDSMNMEMVESYYVPDTYSTGYSSDLESYETTTYSVTGKIKQFDELCSTLKTLKGDSQIHFKSIYETTNNCRANFYVEEARANDVLASLTSFSGVEYTRNTSSVTKHREQLQSQTYILKQQLTSVQKSLTAAETEFDEIAEFAKNANDAATLSEAIKQKLSLVETLTQKKISLTSRLNNLYQQSAELEERMNVIEFSVNITRSNPIYINKDSQKWENAWQDLKDTYTDTLIGLTAFLGVFLLTGIQYLIYLTIVISVLIIVIRGFWKIIKFIWKK